MAFWAASLSSDPRTRDRDHSSWQRIGDNRNVGEVPKWVISAFAGMPGSHGTRLIDYPEPGTSVRFKGRTYRYRIDMGNQSWQVYRRLRKCNSSELRGREELTAGDEGV